MKDVHRFLIRDYEEIMKLQTLQRDCDESAQMIEYYNDYIKCKIRNVCNFYQIAVCSKWKIMRL